jgi:transcription elongation factor Elf1
LRDCGRCGIVEVDFDPYGGPVRCSICGQYPETSAPDPEEYEVPE